MGEYSSGAHQRLTRPLSVVVCWCSSGWAVEVCRHGVEARAGLQAQGPHERPPSHGALETVGVRVQPGATPREPLPRIGDHPGGSRVVRHRDHSHENRPAIRASTADTRAHRLAPCPRVRWRRPESSPVGRAQVYPVSPSWMPPAAYRPVAPTPTPRDEVGLVHHSASPAPATRPRYRGTGPMSCTCCDEQMAAWWNLRTWASATAASTPRLLRCR